MDANGTRFQLLLGKADWSACTSDGAPLTDSAFDWDGVRHELRLRPQLLRTRERATGHPPAPSPEDRRGVARDRHGNWYWLDASARLIWVLGCCDREPARWWPPVSAPRPAPFGGFHAATPLALPPGCRYAGLAVTEDHFLVVGVVDAPGLLVWDLHQGGPPTFRRWPAAIPFAPFDFAATPGGGLAILDRAHQRWWALDRHLAVIRRAQADVELAPAVRDAFQPIDGSAVVEAPAVTFPAGLGVSDASPLPGLDALAIEALADGSVLILERSARIHRFRLGASLGVHVAELSRLVDGDPALVAHDFALAGDRLYIVDGDGDQAFAFAIALTASDFTLELSPEFLPLRLFAGKALVAAGGVVFYDFGNRWVELVDKRRPRFEQSGELETPVFDGRQPQCVWHRLLLDACIAAETSVTVWSRAADDPAELARTPWQAEPALHLRADGSEQPHLGAAPARPTFDLLFQAARGRYLQLRLRLAGDGRTSPRLRALRAYYPRFSYLERYLPGVYREDETSASFLERFLANPEGFYTAIEDKIAAAQILFDPGAAPAEALDWLTSWFGLLADPAWGEARRRLFLKHIMTFFQWRGTRRGLELALRLALDACADDSLFAPGRDPIAGIRIVERHAALTVPATALGDPSSEPRQVPRAARWEPAQRAAELHARYAAWLAAYALPARPYPIRDPHDASAPAWRSFSRAVLGFVPAASAADTAAWHDFLARRYRRPSALARAWASAITGWDQPLPAALPADGAALVDWYVFERVVLGVAALAHRFTVLLPVERDRPYDVAAHEERRRLARRVVEAERPAHTQFDVKLYWAMTRVGEARLGVDTLLDVGSRAPQLLPPMILGQGYLAESYLAGREMES